MKSTNAGTTVRTEAPALLLMPVRDSIQGLSYGIFILCGKDATV